MKKRLIISTAAFFLVCSCGDPNELGWIKIDETSQSIIYLDAVNNIGPHAASGPENRYVKLRLDSKDGYSRIIYMGELNCGGGTFYYTESTETYKNENGSINTSENSFADNPQTLRLTLAADEVLHDAVCGPL